MNVDIPVIHCSKDGVERLFELRDRLSPRGDIVSESGRQRTIELFGEPLTPQQVVARICHDVQTGGLNALLDYTDRLDGKRLTPQTLRVSPEESTAAHAAADPEYLATIRRIRDNIVEFQQAVLPSDVTVRRDVGEAKIELRQRYRRLLKKYAELGERQQKAGRVQRLLAESRLSEEAVSAEFVRLLQEAKDETSQRELIAERQKLWRNLHQRKPGSAGRMGSENRVQDEVFIRAVRH